MSVICGDSLHVLPTLDAESVDAIVCDPPYGLSFMGKGWDHGVPGEAFWREALRVAKPGAHLVAFGGTRTYHRLTCAIEDAGWEIRDCLSWLYGSGFPKSLDVSKAFDRASGDLAPESVGFTVAGRTDANLPDPQTKGYVRPAPVTDLAREWQGWGTALKPAWEPIILARKPLIGTVAANVAQHGTGGINVDGCRIGTTVETWPKSRTHSAREMSRPGSTLSPDAETQLTGPVPSGRWPANVVLDDNAAALLDASQKGLQKADENGPSRFFYTAKASRREREAGLEGMERKTVQSGMGGDMPTDDDGQTRDRFKVTAANVHPTVKPIALMRWLCRLVTPKGGLILDPFTGSGTTGCAAVLEGFRFIGVEREPEYAAIAEKRIAHWAAQTPDADLFTEAR